MSHRLSRGLNEQTISTSGSSEKCIIIKDQWWKPIWILSQHFSIAQIKKRYLSHLWVQKPGKNSWQNGRQIMYKKYILENLHNGYIKIDIFLEIHASTHASEKWNTLALSRWGRAHFKGSLGVLWDSYLCVCNWQISARLTNSG